jgi:hypothetical protein
MTELEPAELTTDRDAPAGLTEADFRGCRFIRGEATPLRAGMFCGATPSAPGSPWCQAHRERVWTASRRRRLTLRKSGPPRAPK